MRNFFFSVLIEKEKIEKFEIEKFLEYIEEIR